MSFFFQKFPIEKNDNFGIFLEKCYVFGNFCHSIVNFPEGQILMSTNIPADQEMTVNQTRDRATCMTSGEDIYRTFDNVYYHYHHPCAVGLLVSSFIDIYTFTECDPVDKCACYKVSLARVRDVGPGMSNLASKLRQIGPKWNKS